MYTTKWLTFVEIPTSGTTEAFYVMTKDRSTTLGEIRWFGRFRKYAFFPEANMVFDSVCLYDIKEWMDKLMEKWRDNRAKSSTGQVHPRPESLGSNR